MMMTMFENTTLGWKKAAATVGFHISILSRIENFHFDSWLSSSFKAKKIFCGCYFFFTWAQLTIDDVEKFLYYHNKKKPKRDEKKSGLG